jgi:hypothetical protein
VNARLPSSGRQTALSAVGLLVALFSISLPGASRAAPPDVAPVSPQASPPRGARSATLAGGTAAQSRAAASTARGGNRLCETAECFLELGTQEFADGNFKAAAEHLRYGLSIFPPNAKPELKKASEEVYAKARAQVATVQLMVNPADADVKIGGRAIPLDQRAEVFVQPGDIVVEAGAKGHEPYRETVNALKNWTMHVRVTLKPVGSAGPTASVTTTVAPTSVPISPGPSKALVIGGAAVAGAVLIVGGVLAGVAEGTRSQLQADAPKKPDGTAACSSSEPATGANETCNDLRARAAVGNALGQSGIALLVVGAALGAGTAVYGLWPRSDKSPVAGLVPVVAPGTAGFVWTGSF